ncbi:hypothetical protein HEB29_005280 [Streptomyces fulvorobeus]|uniref:Uncharacterized protein n=1 Tax=Streptomyces fulvorobeus TaxID=284028 RepID=A0A7Y9HGT4_9ACTN|nr:hypothetical protein [Streptomyces fulvorobeus]
MQCKDIPDDVFVTAVRDAPALSSARWRMRWQVAEELESVMGPIPENLFMAKARRLIARGLIGGCPCGCRGDWHPADECYAPGNCCRPS